jgi:hypothetical protein
MSRDGATGGLGFFLEDIKVLPNNMCLSFFYIDLHIFPGTLECV